MEPTLRIGSVYQRAQSDLDFIRKTMERATAFTAVPGIGLVVNGLLAGLAYLVTRSDAIRANADHWLAIWVACAAVAATNGVVCMIVKARRAGIALLSGPGRRFLVALLPPFAAAGLLTFVLAHAGLHSMLPGIWLLLYGVGILTGGAFAIRPVVLMGGCFFLLGTAALLLPSSWGGGLMLAGFGIVQVIFGIVITSRYGG